LQVSPAWGKLRAMSAPPIVVALSGGVDSATCAGLLVEAGERVVGISMRLYNAHGTESASGGRCCGPRDLEDARAVCAHLGIPFYVADYEEDFRRAVIDDFVSSYREGRTPNPCVRCNEKVKFLPLLHRARALGASALCTGHYARIQRAEGGSPRLCKAVDGRKDQSYFLFGMPKKALDYVRFPLGGLTKEEVRAHALRLGLPNANKPESQEICFVPDGDYAGFVERHGQLRDTAGEIVDESGAVVGHHDGIHRYTVGQRRGLGGGQGAP
jgi:tRNA-specific 2-thiouridylase